MRASSSYHRPIVALSLLAAACSASTLEVEPEGEGRITGEVHGDRVLDCRERCAHQSSTGFTMTLRAIPAAGERLVRWRGDARSCGEAPTCTLSVPHHAAYRASALFTPNAPTSEDEGDFAGPCYGAL